MKSSWRITDMAGSSLCTDWALLAGLYGLGLKSARILSQLTGQFTRLPDRPRRMCLQKRQQLPVHQRGLFQMAEMTGTHQPVQLHAAGKIRFHQPRVEQPGIQTAVTATADHQGRQIGRASCRERVE